MTSLYLLPALLLHSANPTADYVRDIKPLLAKHCISCHGPEKQKASLRLDCAEGLRGGGNSGPVLVPRKSAQSLLIQAVTGAEGVNAMPPKGPRLGTAEIALLRNWIDEGAILPAGETGTTVASASKHWSFQPIV